MFLNLQEGIFTYLLTYILTYLHYGAVFPEKLTGSQVVKKFLAFCATWWFITTFTSARHLSLSWSTSIQSIPPKTTSWRSILILSSHLSLDLPSGLFPSVSSPKSCIQLFSPHTSYMSRPPHSFRCDHPKNIWWRVQITKLLVT